MFDAYGLTESTVVANLCEVAADGPVGIGGPIRGIDELVLDDRLRPVPVGVAGELYPGGPRVGVGLPEPTRAAAGRFVADPFTGPGSRMYRTKVTSSDGGVPTIAGSNWTTWDAPTSS